MIICYFVLSLISVQIRVKYDDILLAKSHFPGYISRIYCLINLNATAECSATLEATAKLGPKASADATTKDESTVKAWCKAKSKAAARAC